MKKIIKYIHKQIKLVWNFMRKMTKHRVEEVKSNDERSSSLLAYKSVRSTHERKPLLNATQ